MYSLFKQRLPRISSDLKEQGMQIWTPDLAFVRQQPRGAGIILVEITISPTLRTRPASIRFAGFVIRLCLHQEVSCFNLIFFPVYFRKEFWKSIEFSLSELELDCEFGFGLVNLLFTLLTIWQITILQWERNMI